MESNGDELYARSVLDIKPGDDKSARIFKNLIASPLPYSGVSALPLSELPKGYDDVRVLTTRNQSFTSWNSQSHAILVSYGTAVHEAVAAPRKRKIPTQTVCVLAGPALEAALKERDDLTTMQLEGLRNATRWLTATGSVIKRKPQKVVYRNTVMTGKALERFRSVSAPPPVASTSQKCVEDLLADASDESEAPEYTEFVPEPPPTGMPLNIPVRSVQPTLVSIQGTGPVTVPKAQAYSGLEAYISEKGHMSQGLVPGTRSAVARDTPSAAYMVSYMEGSNASFIDTAPMLRALLYVYPAHVDAWQLDKIDRQFIRQQVAQSRSDLRVEIYPVDVPVRCRMEAICVTLPAFTEHLKGVDTLLGNLDPAISGGYNMSEMDNSWAVVPIDSYILLQPWLLEYIVAFMSSEHWNGRTNWIWTNNYQGAGAMRFRGYLTTMPAAHSVYVPGPNKVMLVLLEDSAYARNRTINIPGVAAAVNVYPGVRSVTPVPANLNDYLVDLTPAWHNAFTSALYPLSAQRMMHVLNYMEEHLSTNMAFASAVTLASELVNVMPEGMQIRLADQSRNYTNIAYGAWTYGARNLGPRNPQMRTNDVNAGNMAHRDQLLARMVGAYSYAMLSPCLQYAASSATTVNRDVIHHREYLGKMVRWANQRPDNIQPQYTCHVSHSVYRVMRCLGYVVKNDYAYRFMSLGGVQNTLTNNGVLITLALSLAMGQNDISLRVWSGLGSDESIHAHMASKNLVANWTNKMIQQRHPNYYFANTIVEGETSVDAAFEHYYGSESTDSTWATHIPLPMFMLAQWAMRCDVSLAKDFRTEYGRVAGQLTARYSTFKFGNHPMLPLAAGTADLHSIAPASYLQRLTMGSEGLPMNVDEWAELTSGSFPIDIVADRFQSNILSVSMRYHHQDTSNDGQIAVISDMLASKMSFASLLGVDPMLYPDPPNPEVFWVPGPEDGNTLPPPQPQDKDQEAPVTQALTQVEVKAAQVQAATKNTGPVEEVATGPKLSGQATVQVPETPAAQPAIPVLGPSPTGESH